MLRRLAVLCTASFALLAFLPSAASAHHASITASSDCRGLVSYTATSWASDNSGVNNSVSISINGATVNSGAFNGGNGYAISGTYQLPSPLPGSFTATVNYGNFGPAGEFGSAGSASSGARTVDPCPVPPAAPGGTIGDVVCSQGGATVSLSNTGGLATDITILRNGAAVETVNVAAGGSATRLVTVPEDTTAAITLVSGGTTIASRSVAADCVQPPAVPGSTIGDIVCADGGAHATLTNTGGEDAVFTVSLNGTATYTVTVPGGETRDQLVPIAENTTATIDVASGAHTNSKTVTRDCIPPAVPSGAVGDISCTDGGAYATLTNTGGETATFTVTVNGALLDTLTVTGGSTAYRLVPIAEDTSADVAIASGAFATNRTIARDCTPPPVTPPVTPPTSADGTPTPTPTPNPTPAVDVNTTFPGNGPSVPATSDLVTPTPVVNVTPAAANAETPVAAASVPVAATGELPFTGAPSSTPIVLLALGLIGLGGLLAADTRHRRMRRRVAAENVNS